MASDAASPKKSSPARRRPQPARGKPVPKPFEVERPAGEPLYCQVHFQPVPGARKALFDALRPKLTECLQDMMRHGQLLFCGGYPTSIGGMWLLKVQSRAEAEQLVLEHPAVSASLLTWRLLELQEPSGLVVQSDRASHPLETIES